MAISVAQESTPQPEPAQAVRQTLNWPAEIRRVSDYSTPALLGMAFPHLFPDSGGDPTDPDRSIEVTLKEASKHLLRLGNVENGNVSFPFARDIQFPYWVLNTHQRHSMIEQAKVFRRTNYQNRDISTEELQQLLAQGNAGTTMHKIVHYAAKVPGSPPYWAEQRQRLDNICKQLNCPTFFSRFRLQCIYGKIFGERSLRTQLNGLSKIKNGSFLKILISLLNGST